MTGTPPPDAFKQVPMPPADAWNKPVQSGTHETTDGKHWDYVKGNAYFPPPGSKPPPNAFDAPVSTVVKDVQPEQRQSFLQRNDVPVFNTLENPIDPANPDAYRDLGPMTRDKALLEWDKAKAELARVKEREMRLRKFCVLTFPERKEGTNKLELGEGYAAVAKIKFNYGLRADPDWKDNEDVTLPLDEQVERTMAELARTDNELGPAFADALFKWSIELVESAYKQLNEKKDDPRYFRMLKLVQRVVYITDAAPTLEIREPKK